MYPTFGKRVFEYDDYPNQWQEIIAFCDRIKRKCPGFKGTLFAVPKWMNNHEHFEAVAARSDWLRLGVHGWNHKRHEFSQRSRGEIDTLIYKLCEAVRDKPYRKLWKAAWYGMNRHAFEWMAKLGYTICQRTMVHLPYPASQTPIWSYTDCDYRRDVDDWQYLDTHPTDTQYGANKGGITEGNQEKWLASFKPSDEWAFTEDVSEPLCAKANIGCGYMVWDGWTCLDPRQEIDERIWRWDASQMLPWAANRVDVALVSHLFEYLEESEYETLLLEVWRVLRPGAVLRLTDIDTESGFRWREIGSTRTHGTGTIKSHPTKQRLMLAMRRVGFHVFESRPGVTASPHQDVLQGDSRRKRYRHGQKFYAEGIKAVAIPDEGRPRWVELRATRRGRGRYRLIDWVKVITDVKGDSDRWRSYFVGGDSGSPLSTKGYSDG